MLNDTVSNTLKTEAYVVKRVNYGEADRIVTFITPSGKIAALARGVRKEKSKLAGGLEAFVLTEICVRMGKKDLGTITGAKMLCFYKNILKNLDAMNLVADCLKKINKAAEGVDNAELFFLIQQTMKAVNSGASLRIVEVWFLLNLMRAVGEEVNLYTDDDGNELVPGRQYSWNEGEGGFKDDRLGEFGENEIKLMRFMLRNSLLKTVKVRVGGDTLEKVYGLIRRIADDIL